MIKKRILSAISAAAMAITMAVGSVSAKDMGINGTYTQGTTLGTFFKSDCLGYESIELNYEYVQVPENASESFGILAFDSDWGGWNKTSIGQVNPALNVEYTSTVELSDIESSLTTGKDFYGFNLITDNFGTGSVKVNSVILNDKQGQETTITGSWHKGTASAMTVTGDSEMEVDANAYNIYMSGFSGYGFTNPTVDVTVSYDSTASGFKEATLYYVDNYNTDQEVWTGVEPESARYKEVQAGKQVTYSFSIDGTRHSLFACFDECTVSEIKVYDKTPDDTVITGNWTKGTASELTLESGNTDFWFSGGEDSIYVFNFSLEGYRSPTIEVTANYSSIPADGSYMQAELYSDNAKIGGSFIPVTLGEHKYTFDVSKDLTEFNVCFDGCTVTKVKIYDNRSPVPAEVSGKTADELAGMMGKAWNLGNVLDSTSDGTVGETLWNNKFPVSKEMFDAVKAAGFDTVRIPVSYMDKIVENADGTYTIDSAYMARVKQVVDAAISANLFVIVNIHNDGGNGVEDMWLDITKTGDEFTVVQNKFAGVWSSIANTFADYDQKLIFEGFNELNNGNYNSTPSTSEIANVNSLNAKFVETVRNVGGKNTDRLLIVSGYNADINNTILSFVKPNDTSINRLMLSVHYYDPYDFTLNENGTNAWDLTNGGADMESQIIGLADFALTNDMPVFIGEYGAIDKNNTSARANYYYWLNYYADNNELEVKFVTSCWDNGDINQNGFALFDRTTNTVTPTGSTLISAIMGNPVASN